MDKETIRTSVQTIEYMLARNSYNEAQHKALTEALKALRMTMLYDKK